jgi:hypothetical protein
MNKVNKKRYRASGWEPTDEVRMTVCALVAADTTVEEIALIVHPDGPISESTVRRKFKEELLEGRKWFKDFWLRLISETIQNQVIKVPIVWKEWFN